MTYNCDSIFSNHSAILAAKPGPTETFSLPLYVSQSDDRNGCNNSENRGHAKLLPTREWPKEFSYSTESLQNTSNEPSWPASTNAHFLNLEIIASKFKVSHFPCCLIFSEPNEQTSE